MPQPRAQPVGGRPGPPARCPSRPARRTPSVQPIVCGQRALLVPARQARRAGGAARAVAPACAHLVLTQRRTAPDAPNLPPTTWPGPRGLRHPPPAGPRLPGAPPYRSRLPGRPGRCHAAACAHALTLLSAPRAGQAAPAPTHSRLSGRPCGSSLRPVPPHPAPGEGGAGPTSWPVPSRLGWPQSGWVPCHHCYSTGAGALRRHLRPHAAAAPHAVPGALPCAHNLLCCCFGRRGCTAYGAARAKSLPSYAGASVRNLSQVAAVS